MSGRNGGYFILNRKLLDPRDSLSPEVLQLETAMGSALSSIPKAQVLRVPRDRFIPIKTTADLLVVMSDCYELTARRELRRAHGACQPVVILDDQYFRFADQLHARTRNGVPSMNLCTSLEICGDVNLDSSMVFDGDVQLFAESEVMSPIQTNVA